MDGNNSLDRIYEIVDDHGERIRKLEDASIRAEVQLKNIEIQQLDIKNGMTDLKATVLDVNRENTKQMNKTIDSFTQIIQDAMNSNNEVKLVDRKELWAIAALVVGWLLNHFVK